MGDYIDDWIEKFGFTISDATGSYGINDYTDLNVTDLPTVDDAWKNMTIERLEELLNESFCNWKQCTDRELKHWLLIDVINSAIMLSEHSIETR